MAAIEGPASRRPDLSPSAASASSATRSGLRSMSSLRPSRNTTLPLPGTLWPSPCSMPRPVAACFATASSSSAVCSPAQALPSREPVGTSSGDPAHLRAPPPVFAPPQAPVTASSCSSDDDDDSENELAPLTPPAAMALAASSAELDDDLSQPPADGCPVLPRPRPSEPACAFAATPPAADALAAAAVALGHRKSDSAVEGRMARPRARPCPGPVSVAAQPSSFDVSVAAAPTCVGIVSASWASLTSEDDDIDEEELAPMTSPASKRPLLPAQPCVGREAEASDGWQVVLPRRGARCPASPAPALPPRPSISAWLFGRCCRCLAHGHRAAVRRDPFRCSRCLENGHRARESRNAWRPLSSLACLAAPPVPSLDAVHRHAPASCGGPMRSALPSTVSRPVSWASVVSAPDGSLASADMSLRSALEGQAELLRYELLGMASFRLEETVQPLRDVVDSMQGWMLRIGSFLKRAEAALDRLSLTPPVLQTATELRPVVVPDVDVTDESGADLYGRFSPRVGANSTVMDPVRQIMPELQELCGEPALPLSDEQTKVDSRASLLTLDLEESGSCNVDGAVSISPESIRRVVATTPSPPPPEPCQPPASVDSGGVLAPSSDALFAKELCGLLASLEAASTGYGKGIACVLAGKASEDIITKVEKSLSKVSLRGKRKKRGVARKASSAA